MEDMAIEGSQPFFEKKVGTLILKESLEFGEHLGLKCQVSSKSAQGFGIEKAPA